MMKTARFLCVVLFTGLMIAGVQPVHGGWDQLLNTLKTTVGEGSGLSTGEIVSGLKEALEVGTGKAVETVGKKGGYLLDPEIKIPLPESVQKIQGVLKAMGYGSQMEAFDKSMNRAAEVAAPQAKAIFWDSIKKMTFSDAKGILQGGDTAATEYLKDKSSARLTEVFRPIVHGAMSEVGVTSKYQELSESIKNLPFTESLKLNLDDYVTAGALKGLFYKLGQEEKKIRQDPAARGTELLKKVFGESS